MSEIGWVLLAGAVIIPILVVIIGLLAAKGYITEESAKRIIASLRDGKFNGDSASSVVARLRSNEAGDPLSIVGKIDDMVKDVKGKKKRPVLKRLVSLGGAILLNRLKAK